MPINSEQLEPLIKDYQLADSLPKELEVSTVELLIGNDNYCDLVSLERQKEDLIWVGFSHVERQLKKIKPQIFQCS